MITPLISRGIITTTKIRTTATIITIQLVVVVKVTGVIFLTEVAMEEDTYVDVEDQEGEEGVDDKELVEKYIML